MSFDAGVVFHEGPVFRGEGFQARTTSIFRGTFWGKTLELNSRVHRYTKLKAFGSNKNTGGTLYWMLVLLGLSFLAWIWWKSADSGGHKTAKDSAEAAPQQAEETNRARSPIVVVRKALPAAISLASLNVPPARTGANSLFSESTFELQVALARQGISSGSLDGVWGSQTRSALRAFQEREHLPGTGQLDETTLSRLSCCASNYTFYVITSNDLARLRPLSATWLGKSRQDRLDYETILEVVAEKGHAHPNLVRALNPGINWTNVAAGTLAKIPNAEYPPTRGKAAFVRIHLGEKTLQAFDENTNLLVHFPCSIARRVEKRPVGGLHVEKLAVNPNYLFNPELFPESAEARHLGHPLMIPSGPNNPVGTAWISLDKPGYGIHGTPRPEEVGRTESHGCFRLANWNADYLLGLVWIGMPVYVEP